MTIRDELNARTRLYFTNRKNELSVFRELLELTEPEHFILHVFGVGGVGKSVLLQEYKAYCEGLQFPVLLVNCSEQRNPLEVLGAFDTEFGRRKEMTAFRKSKNRLERIVNDLWSQEDKSSEKGKNFWVRASFSAIKTFIPFAAPLIDGISLEDKLEKSIHDHINLKLSEDDEKFFLKAEDYLTSDLIRGLGLTSGGKKTILMFDTYETVTELLDTWIREKLIAQLPKRCVVVISGRDRLGEKWQEWKPIIREIELLLFDELDSRLYLTKRGITDEGLIKELVGFSRGYPMCLAVSADLGPRRGEFDESEKFVMVNTLVERLLNRIQDRDIRQALDACAVVRYFNQETLKALIPQDDSYNLFRALQKFSFVYSREQGLALHDVVREYMISELKYRSPERFLELSSKALGYYEERLIDARGETNERLTRELLYHQLVLNEEKGLALFKTLFDTASRLFRLGLCKSLIGEMETWPNLLQKGKHWVIYCESALAVRQSEWDKQEKILVNLINEDNLEPELRAYVTNDLAAFYVRSGHLDRAKQMLYETQQLRHQLHDMAGAADALFELAKVYRLEGNWAKVQECYDQCLPIYKQTNNLNQEARVYLHIGPIYQLKGDWKLADEWLHKALGIFEELGNEYGAARAYFNIGWIRLLQGKLDQAEGNFRNCLQTSEKFGSRNSIAVTLIGLSHVYRATSRFRECRRALAESRQIIKELNYRIFMGMLLDSYGQFFEAVGRRDYALSLLIDSIKTKEEIGEQSSLALTLNLIGNLKSLQAKHDEAVAYFERSLGVLHLIESKYYEAEAYLGLWNCFVELHYNIDQSQLDNIKRLATEHEYWDIMANALLIEARANLQTTTPNDLGRLCRESCSSAIAFNLHLFDKIAQDWGGLFAKYMILHSKESALQAADRISTDWVQDKALLNKLLGNIHSALAQ